MHNRILILLGFFIFSTAEAAPVSVDTASTPGNAIRSPSIGATLSATTRPYEGIGSQIATLPYFGFATGDFYVRGLDVGYRLNRNQTLQWDLTAMPRFLGYKESDSTVLNGLGNTDYSIHGGVSVSGATGSVNLSIRLLTDLLNESGGTEVIGSASRVFIFEKMNLIPTFAVNWQNRKLVDHYFGISDSQENAERVAYAGDATFNAALSLTATYSVTKSLTFVGATRYDHFGSEIKNSPIVANNDSSSLTVGLIYSY